ncbi:HalOD1 output domain-containing protein [Natronolimnohabitans sp. A-GB9]|uniref:HalOD1 output domain-containing protein n=1 Tax=Natronolimnohabitans sp. A-GB9 TaxID=3069757 RepID=UPI0027B66D54|nr:HalOD1 output domain-containing protein [Natronolimnohabitans sp. A-GB9]MDQ2051342.1 HalOD1 output domain-containing protein [Natronolimnohabitans sp. A-GB9]
MGTGVSPSLGIVTRIASSEGVSPTDLEPPLHDVVDTDALDRLVAASHEQSTGADTAVKFTYHGYHVHVDGTGTIDVTATDELPGAEPESTEGPHGD